MHHREMNVINLFIVFFLKLLGFLILMAKVMKLNPTGCK